MLNINPNYYKDLPTLVNENVENELLKRTEKTLYNLIKENSHDFNKITNQLITKELERMIVKLNSDANVKSFDIKLILAYIEDLSTNESTDLDIKTYLYYQPIKSPMILVKYLINNSNMLYDNRINSKVLAYKNSFINMYYNKENKDEEM